MDKFHPHAIVEISVEGLFGYIDQELTPDVAVRDKISRLAILYGENGTGKTTLLRLAFHLLSPRVDRGHKSRLSTTPFKLLRVTLRDGTTFKAERDTANRGDFSFSVKKPKRRALTHRFVVEPDGSGITPYAFAPELQEAISSCASTFVFLRDDRKIEIEPNVEPPTLPREVPTVTTTWMSPRKLYRDLEHELIGDDEEPNQLGVAVGESLRRLERWFTVEYGRGTSTGMASSHAIYEQVIERVVSTRSPQQPLLSLDSLIDDLSQLSETSEIFVKYGLSSPMNAGSIVQALRKASGDQIELLGELLVPYIDTVRARYSALKGVYDTLDTFIKQTNRFMNPKTVRYRLGEGITIHSPRDQRLNPTALSSGEKHLLLILSNAVLARDARTLFIIDEPEISLNSTWQRSLAAALLDLSENSVNQFLMASHSHALITGHRDHVLRLTQG